MCPQETFSLYQQKLYLIQDASTSAFATKTFPAGGDALDPAETIGVEGDATLFNEGTPANMNPIYGFQADATPNLASTTQLVETQIRTGIFTPDTLRHTGVTGVISPITFTGLFNSYLGSALFWSLFQSGASKANGTGDVDILTFIPYVDPEPEIFFHIVRQLVPNSTTLKSDAKSQYLAGVIVRSLTISGSEAGLITFSAECLACDSGISTTNLLDDSGSSTTFADADYVVSTRAPLKFEAFTCEYDGTAVKIPSFELTLTNNATANLFNATTVQQVTLGEIMGTLTIDFPIRDANSALSDQEMRVVFTGYEATKTTELIELFTVDGADSANSIDINGRFIIKEEPERVELESGLAAERVTFELCQDTGGTNITVLLGIDGSILNRNIQ